MLPQVGRHYLCRLLTRKACIISAEGHDLDRWRAHPGHVFGWLRQLSATQSATTDAAKSQFSGRQGQK